MFVNPGKLNKKIVIFKKSGKKDKDGFPLDEREIVRSAWASFRRTTGSEKMTAGTDIADVRARFLVRTTDAEITTNMFIEYKGEVYNIVFANDYNDSGEYTEIWVRKG